MATHHRLGDTHRRSRNINPPLSKSWKPSSMPVEGPPPDAAQHSISRLPSFPFAMLNLPTRHRFQDMIFVERLHLWRFLTKLDFSGLKDSNDGMGTCSIVHWKSCESKYNRLWYGYTMCTCVVTSHYCLIKAGLRLGFHQDISREPCSCPRCSYCPT
jgi:hypothetical protein